MNKHQKGFTLIELVMVIVILGILAALAVPRFVDVQTESEQSARAQVVGATKSAFAAYIAENRDFPTLTLLGGYVQGGDALATGAEVGTGVAFSINDSAGWYNYKVLTYTDTDCATATTGVGDTVKCVGGDEGVADTDGIKGGQPLAASQQNP